MATYSQDTGLVLQQTSTPLTMIWGDFVTSPLWYLLFFARFFVLWAIASAFAFWDLIVTIFTSFWEIATNLLYIVPIVGIFIGLYFMHMYVTYSILCLRNADTGRPLRTFSSTTLSPSSV